MLLPYMHVVPNFTKSSLVSHHEGNTEHPLGPYLHQDPDMDFLHAICGEGCLLTPLATPAPLRNIQVEPKTLHTALKYHYKTNTSRDALDLLSASSQT